MLLRRWSRTILRARPNFQVCLHPWTGNLSAAIKFLVDEIGLDDGEETHSHHAGEKDPEGKTQERQHESDEAADSPNACGRSMRLIPDSLICEGPWCLDPHKEVPAHFAEDISK